MVNTKKGEKITSDMMSDWLSPNPPHITEPLSIIKTNKSEV